MRFKDGEYLFGVGLTCLSFVVITKLEVYIGYKIMEIIIFGFCCRIIIIYFIKCFFLIVYLVMYKKFIVDNFILLIFEFFIYNILKRRLEFDKLLILKEGIGNV